MPEISRFFGIVIYMYANDHNPPHFHAEYSGEKAIIDIATGNIIEGKLSKRALSLVKEWTEIHQEELNKNFVLLRQETQTYFKIEPLK